MTAEFGPEMLLLSRVCFFKKGYVFVKDYAYS